MIETTAASRGAMVIAFCVVLALCGLPIIAAQYPHLLDYPGHLARIKILLDYEESQFYQELYQINNLIVPNIAFDRFTLLFSKIMPLNIAGKLFLLLTFSLIIGGCIAMHKAIFYRWSFWPLVVSVFLYNAIFRIGLLNYYAGLGLMLLGIAVFINIKKKSYWHIISVGSIFSLGVYFAHAISYAIYAIIIGGIALQNSIFVYKQSQRKGVLYFTASIIPLLIPVAYQLLFIHNNDQKFMIEYSGLLWKLKVVVLTFLWDSSTVDILTYSGLSIIGVILFLKGKLKFSNIIILPTILLIFTFLLAPMGLMGAWHLDTRIPIAIVFIIIAGVDFKIESLRWRSALMILVAGILVLRMFTITLDWNRYDIDVNAVRESFKKIQPESTLMLASCEARYPPNKPDNRYWKPIIHHAIAYAVMDKKVFVPDIWGDKLQHSINIAKCAYPIYNYQENSAILIRDNKSFDKIIEKLIKFNENLCKGESYNNRPLFLLVIFKGELDLAEPPNAQLIINHPKFSLYKLIKSSNHPSGSFSTPDLLALPNLKEIPKN